MGKLVAIETFERFLLLLNDNQILDTSLIFILDTGLFYTHGILFNSVSYGAINNDTVTLNVGGTSKTLSLASHTHSNYYTKNADLDIDDYKIVSGSAPLLYYEDDVVKVGSTSTPTYLHGTLKAIRGDNTYTILDTGNTSIENKTISGVSMSNVATFKYGNSNFQLDYVKRENTIIALDTLASYTNMGTTNENSKFYGFMTMYTDGRAIDPKFAQIRINIDDNILEFRSSSNRNWTGLLLGGAYKNITINGTTYSLVTKSNSLPTLYIPTSLGNGGQYLSVADDGGSLVWRTVTIPEIVANSKTQNGVVLKGQGNPNKVWMTDADGAPNWRDLNVNSILSAATTTVLGGVKVQSINTNAITPNTNAESSGRYYGVRLDANELAYVNVPWQDTWIAWKGATDSANGTAGYMPAPTSALRNKFLRGDGSWVSLNNYSLPTASNTTLGGVKTGAAITDVTGYTAVAIKDGIIYYKDTNTTYSFSNLLFLQTSGTNLMTYNSQAVRTVLAGSNITFTHSNNVLTIAAKDTTYSNVSKTAAGLCPALPNETTTTKYLRLDGSWLTPPDNNTWKAANSSLEGYVPKSTANKILRANADGALYWGDDANTTYTFYNLLFQNSGGTTVDTYKPTTKPTKTLKAGSNVTISAASNVITIASTDTNTWRGIQNNLTSSSNTTESLSAKQGYLLANGSARDNTKLPLAGGTMVGTISAANDAYGGGGFNNGYANIILRGNTTTGTSGIVFSSSKGDTSINRPSDCAFIQFLPYGVAAATAVGTNPTINTSGEAGRFVIGIHNDSGDLLWLQTSATNDLKHVVGANVYTIYDSGNLPAYPTKSSWNYDDRYVSSLTTSGNYLRWVKNGSNNDITIPYASSAGSATHASYLTLTYCNSSTNSGLWNTIKNGSSNTVTNKVNFYTIYNNGGPTTYGEMLEILSCNANHWQPQLWFAAGKSAHLYYRNKNYNDNSWGNWLTILDSDNSSVSKSGETLTVKINGTSQSLTNTNTTYSGSSTVTLSGTTFSLTKANVTTALGYTPPTTNSTYNFSGTTFYSGNSGNAEHNCNNAVKNGNYYYTSNGPSGLGNSTSDGALYVQSYSDSWVGQIAQDYRNGRLWVRGRNNGSWQSWVRIANYNEIPSSLPANGGNADTVDNQHFKWSNDSNSPTYLWAANSSGTAFLCARGSMSVNYASSAGNADTVDSQHFTYSNADNNPTYLWGTNSNGSSILAHRASMSVNYANSAGSASSCDYANYVYCSSHIGSWRFSSDWDGSYFWLTAKYSGSLPCAVSYASSAGSTSYASSAGYADSCGSFSGAWAIEGGNEVNLIPSSFGYNRLWFNYTAKGGSHVNLDSNYFGNAHTGTVNCYAASFGNSSDIRYKQIIEYVDLSLEQVAYAPIFKFYWTNKSDSKLHAGSSALYWLGVVRELVHYDDYIDLYFLNYGETALISAVTVAKETLNLKNIVLLLQSENEQLKSRISMLESTVRLLTES